MGGASSKKKEPLLQEGAVSSFTDVVQARRVAGNLIVNRKRNFELIGNINENKEWMMHSTIFLKEGSTVRTEVEEAFDILVEAGKGLRFNSDLEDLTVGPALSYAFKANCVTWGFFVAMAFVGKYFVHVDKDHGLATPPHDLRRILSLLALLVAYLGASLYYELCAAYHVLPTQGCAVDREAVGHSDSSENEEKLCGGPLKFDKWMTVMLSLSVCFHFDIYTMSLFVGRVRKSVGYCGALELHWQEVLHDSPLLKAVAGQFTFEGIVLFAWFGMLCQFLFALMFSMPLSKGVTYKVVKKIKDIEKYRTLLKVDQTHGRALQALADSGRMNCLNWQDDYYLSYAEEEWPLEEMAREMRRVNARFFLFALQALLVPNLQVTFLGMQKVASSGQTGSDWLTVTSIAVSVLSGLHYIYYERHHLKFHYEKFQEAHENSVNGVTTRRAVEPDGTVDIQYYWKRARFSWWFSRVVCFMFVPLFLLLFVKTYMAMTVCESGVWNAKFSDDDGKFNWEAGCVPLNHFQVVRCAEGA